jgi:hypothetical protein
VPEHQKQDAIIPGGIARSVLAGNEKFVDFVLGEVLAPLMFGRSRIWVDSDETRTFVDLIVLVSDFCIKAER